MSRAGVTVMDRPEPWRNPDPALYHFEPVEEGDDWKLADGRRCSFPRCNGVSILAMNRSVSSWQRQARWDRWMHYCPEHNYSRWVEDGKVWMWKLVANAE